MWWERSNRTENAGEGIRDWLSKFAQSGDTPGYQYLQQLMGKGGGSAAAFRAGSGGAPAFYQKQMDAEDPLGLIAGAKGFARKTYGPASGAIHQGYNDAARQTREATGGGLQSGGVNPAMRGAMKGMLAAGKAGDLGTLWGNLQAQQQQFTQKALGDTGAYRKGAADAASQWGAGLAGAEAQDQGYLASLGSSALGYDQSRMQAVTSFLAQLLGPLMQRQGWKQGGFSPDQANQFLADIFRAA